MFKANMHLIVALAIAAGPLILGAGSVHAATIDRLNLQNGGNACTGALPTFEGSLRKRP